METWLQSLYRALLLAPGLSLQPIRDYYKVQTKPKQEMVKKSQTQETLIYKSILCSWDENVKKREFPEFVAK